MGSASCYSTDAAMLIGGRDEPLQKTARRTQPDEPARSQGSLLSNSCQGSQAPRAWQAPPGRHRLPLGQHARQAGRPPKQAPKQAGRQAGRLAGWQEARRKAQQLAVAKAISLSSPNRSQAGRPQAGRRAGRKAGRQPSPPPRPLRTAAPGHRVTAGVHRGGEGLASGG